MYRVGVMHVESGGDSFTEWIHVQSGGDSSTEWG